VAAAPGAELTPGAAAEGAGELTFAGFGDNDEDACASLPVPDDAHPATAAAAPKAQAMLTTTGRLLVTVANERIQVCTGFPSRGAMFNNPTRDCSHADEYFGIKDRKPGVKPGRYARVSLEWTSAITVDNELQFDVLQALPPNPQMARHPHNLV
jgi:hypothetical protein